MSEERDTWQEYSKLVLKELETLAIGISNLNAELQEIKRDITLLKDREDKVEKLTEWKDKISEVVSPSQLQTLVNDVKALNRFKTKAVTVFIVIQTLFGTGIAILKFLV
jgi:hypothetical protein